MAITDLWVDRYIPQTLDDYVCRDSALKNKIDQWLSDGALPHLIFSGRPGTGKTSLMKLLLRLLEVPKGDVLFIPASRDRKVDELTDKILGFVSTWALGPSGFKYVVLDEADALSALSQKVLRGEIENPGSMVRFLFTCNHPERLHEAIHSRTQQFHFDSMDRDDFTARAGEILVREDIQFEVDMLLDHVDATYPDLRKCINLLQQDCVNGVLTQRKTEDTGSKDYVIEAANLFRIGKIVEGRNLIVTQALVEEYPDVFRYLYRNLDLWGDTQNQQDDALIIIRNGLVNHALVADIEINLSATLAELTRIRS